MRPRVVGRAAAWVWMMGLLAGLPAGTAAQTPFRHSGIDGAHPGSSVLPAEQVDPASGALAVVATDLVLPANAGFDLRVTRVYNSSVFPDYSSGGSTELEEDSWAGIGWKLHFGRVLNPDATGGGETQIEMGDGSRHALYHGAGGDWITTDFWRYDKATHTLKLPNGVVYVFGRDVFLNARLGTVRYVTEIRDPFDNTLTFSYFDANGPPDGVAQIHQDLGASQTRDVTFTYDPTLKALATMSYNGLTWTYTQQAAGPSGFSVLTAARPPLGPATQYEYASGLTGELTRITTPAGGALTYTYADATRRAGSLSMLTRVVATRTTGGPNITAGTWTYSYGTGPNQDTTVVDCPCGTTRYRFYGTGVAGDFTGWSAGTLVELTIEDSGTVLERQTLAWVPSETISSDPVPGVEGVWADSTVRRPLLTQTVVTRGAQSWTTTQLYHTGLGNYNDYGRAYQIEEVGETVYQVRRTTLTFQYGFTPYLVDRVASSTLSVQTGYGLVSGPVTRTWTYDLATGFLTAEPGVATFEATPRGNVAAATDALGHRTTYAYSWGVLQEVHGPATQTTLSVSVDGLVTGVDNHLDTATQYVYDANLRPVEVRRTGLNSVFYEYDDTNARFVRVARDQAQTETQLDGFGRGILTITRVGLRTRVERDACGRVTFASAPYTQGAGSRGTTTQYDVLGRVTQVTDPAGALTRFLYTGIDVTRIDAETRTTSYDYLAFSGPGSERLQSVQDATGTTTSYEYDLWGNLTKVTGPLPGLTRSWTRDDHGWVLSENQPESGTTSYTYDAAGNLTQVSDANGITTTFAYDAENRLATRNAPGTVDDLAVTYDGAGRTASLSGGGVTTSFTYDPYARLATRTDVTAGPTFVSTYGYDANDNLTTLTYPSGRVVGYAFDAEHRLTAVNQNGAPFAQSFTYDDAGRLAGYLTGAVTHTFTYDTADRPARILAAGTGGTLDLTYTYDQVGNVRGIADPRPGASQSFTVDPLDRLASADGPWGQRTWTYDAAGNRLTQGGTSAISYSYQAATQRLLASTGAIAESFTYDQVGQLTSDSRGTYTYSPLGRLATATSAGVAATYTYDAAGTRLAKTVNGQTTYTVRSAAGDVLSEYRAPCSAPVWSRDVIYGAGRPLGAVRSAAAEPTVSVSAPSLSTPESGALSVSFTLGLPGSEALACAVTAAYHTTAGTASAGADYGETSGTVTFPAGSAGGATRSVSVPIAGDSLDEEDETFFVDLASVIGGIVGPTARTTVTIVDDDAPPSLSVDDVTVVEGQSGPTTATFTVRLSMVSGRTVQVGYATADGTATAGSDYLAASGTVTMPPGTLTATIPVTVLGDTICEPAEQFWVHLATPVHATIADGDGAGTITDDDPVAATLGADRTFPLAAGTPITWTASASGATGPYEYQFRLYHAGLGTWRVVQDYSSASTFVWTPALSGTYAVAVYVRSAGTANDHDAEATSGSVAITAAPAVAVPSLSANVTFPAAAGTAVTWTATATGGAPPLQYQFLLYDPAPAAWTVLREYGASPTVSWTPRHPGDYALQVWVRGAGSTAAYDAWTSVSPVSITAVPPTLLALTPDHLLPAAPGTTVTWTATAAGGSVPLESAFFLYTGASTSWSQVQAYGAPATWAWTVPAAHDTYAVQVWARAAGSPNAYDTWLGMEPFVIEGGPVGGLSLTVSQTFPLAPQTPITWTAAASGGTAPLDYQWVLYDGGTQTWAVVQGWSGAATFTWTPAVGDYGIRAVQVWVRSTGSGAAWEAWAGSGYFLIIP